MAFSKLHPFSSPMTDVVKIYAEIESIISRIVLHSHPLLALAGFGACVETSASNSRRGTKRDEQGFLPEMLG